MTSVIIIEDEHDGAEVLSDFLVIKGIDVLAIGSNGLEAIQLYKKFRPDFVLLDLFMPNYDGFYGLKKILECDNNAKVVIVSASCSRDDEEKLIGLGALAIITKPYEIRSLTNILLKPNKEKNSNLANSLYI
jgi:two-component system chemotaxis response regulator CheY